MAHFDEKSGVIPCHTPWGQWYQTIDEVVMEINVPEGTRSKEVKANFTVNNLTCSVCDINIKVSELSGDNIRNAHHRKAVSHFTV